MIDVTKVDVKCTLSPAPRFEIQATSGNKTFGNGNPTGALLDQILAKISTAFHSQKSKISLSVQGTKIVEDPDVVVHATVTSIADSHSTRAAAKKKSRKRAKKKKKKKGPKSG